MFATQLTYCTPYLWLKPLFSLFVVVVVVVVVTLSRHGPLCTLPHHSHTWGMPTLPIHCSPRVPLTPPFAFTGKVEANQPLSNARALSLTSIRYMEWAEANQPLSGWKIKYYKGLGTSTPVEAKAYFAKMEQHQVGRADICQSQAHSALRSANHKHTQLCNLHPAQSAPYTCTCSLAHPLHI
jgi:hypothetical protein